MASKRGDKSKKDRSGRSLAQYGMFDIPTNLNFDSGIGGGGSFSDSGGSDLEAELAALAGGGGAPKPKRPLRKKQPAANLDAMVAHSLRDIPTDEEMSGDDDDPDLLSELKEIAGEDEVEPEPEAPAPQSPSQPQPTDLGTLLSERLKMYEEAEKNAKAAGEASRARRFNRGVKTIKDLLKQVKAGKSINTEDIPPEVSTGPRKPVESTQDPAQEPDSAPSTPMRPAPPIPAAQPEPPQEEEVEIASTPETEINTELVQLLTARRDQYKIAALKAKKAGDSATAIIYIKVAKQFDSVIAAAQNGQPVDLTRMPEAPPDPDEKLEQVQKQSEPDNPPQPVAEAPPEEAVEENLITASSVGEALEQRFEVYKKQEETAKEQGNTSKARRMGRIVKQYEQAIKLHKAGKSIPIDELPTPPGYAPIPVPGAQAPPAAPKAASQQPSPPTPAAPPVPAREPAEEPKPQSSGSHSTRISGNQVPNSRAEKQLQELLKRQKQFKEAALHAKRKGELEQAKEFLRTAKGFEPLIEAATCGLPVDLTTLPISPTAKSHLDEEYDVVMAEECTETDDSNLDVISRLEVQLTKQLKMCLSTRDHHKALGDVAGTNRFDRLALSVSKDLDFVRLAHRTPGAGVPKFHYEHKDFSIVKSFTELGDNDLELTILRGISYTCTNPKEIDTYVKFEFPYPQEEPFKDRTSTVKDTNSPEYNATFIVPIQRTARACQRVFKRHSVKFEIYSKGGFFRGDSLIGTVNAKLQPLETQSELHDSFDLLDGRKKVGGKLEVRMRLRHPIVSQQVEQVQEKWLIIDH